MIAADLHADINELQWISTAYTTTFASMLLVGGTLGDIYGARRRS